jgi:hypothetical protein
MQSSLKLSEGKCGNPCIQLKEAKGTFFGGSISRLGRGNPRKLGDTRHVVPNPFLKLINRGKRKAMHSHTICQLGNELGVDEAHCLFWRKNHVGEGCEIGVNDGQKMILHDSRRIVGEEKNP